MTNKTNRVKKKVGVTGGWGYNKVKMVQSKRTQKDSILPEIQLGRYRDDEPIQEDLINGCLVLEDVVTRHPHLTIENGYSDSEICYMISRKVDKLNTPPEGDDFWKYRGILEVYPRYKGGDGKRLPTVVYIVRDSRWVTEQNPIPTENLVKDSLKFEVVNKVEQLNKKGICISPRTGDEIIFSNFYLLLDVMDVHRILQTISK